MFHLSPSCQVPNPNDHPALALNNVAAWQENPIVIHHPSSIMIVIYYIIYPLSMIDDTTAVLSL